MRDILFRGKAINEDLSVSEKWIVGSLCNEACSPIRIKGETNYTKCPHISIYNADAYLIGFGNLGASEFYMVHPETVGQFTGLTDKNGTKIFEGDIVKTHYANAQKADFIETVVFHNGKFCGFYENNGCKQWTTLYDGVPHLAIDKSVYMDSVEIVGNIHDNPELLEGGWEE
jgi:uncharacterized phage protein (TIGR01671 family)